MSHPECKVDLTKPHITDYTEYEFFKVIHNLHQNCLDKEWRTKAEGMIARVSPCPDITSLLKNESRYLRGIDELRKWYEERGLPGFKPRVIIPITDYTEKEFMQLLIDICACEGTEEEDMDNGQLYRDAVEHPEGYGLIFYPKVHDGSPEHVMNDIKQWYKEQGKPCFKPE